MRAGDVLRMAAGVLVVVLAGRFRQAAGRLGAGWTVVVDGGQATVREPGRDDWRAQIDELVDRISG